MKKLLLLALLCLSFVASNAQNIINKTNCTIFVTPFCYDPVTCNIVNFCPMVAVPGGGTLPLPNCQCQPPFLQGYQVCWGQCPNLCVDVAIPGSPCFPARAGLPACFPCPPAVVSFDAAGNLIIQ